MSNRRLYQVSDSEVTSPEEAKGQVSCSTLGTHGQHCPQGSPGRQG